MTLRVGLLGTGRIADSRLAPALTAAEGATLWSVLSRDGSRAADFAVRQGAAAPVPSHSDLSEMLADHDLDAVFIATPDGLHASQALAALEAGKHVLCEKPMATDSGSAKAMVQAAAAADLRLGVAYHLRWHAGHRELHRRVSDGLLGTLRHARAQWAWPAPDGSNWRASPEVGRWWSLAGVGTHCLDLVRWFLMPVSGEVSRVRSVITSGVWDRPHDETAVVGLEFEGGATGEVVSSVLFPSPTRLELYGELGCAICEGTLGAEGAGTITTPDGILDFEARDPFRGEIEDFAQAVRDRRPPEVSGEEGLRNVEILEAATRDSGLAAYSQP